MMAKIKEIDPQGTTGEISYQILSIYQKPVHYTKIKEILTEIGFYRIRGKEIPKTFSTIRQAMATDERFVKLGDGYYGLKGWDPKLEKHTESKVNLEGTNSDSIDLANNKAKGEEGTDGFEASPEVSTVLLNNVELEGIAMDQKGLPSENILPEGALNFLTLYYTEDEIGDVIKRARIEFYQHFLPEFMNQELSKILEKSGCIN